MAAPNLDEVNTATRKRIIPTIVDNYFKNGPIMAYCRKNRLARWTGGPTVQENFLFKAMKGGPYGKGDTFDITKRQTKTGLTFTPAFYEVNVTEFTEDVEVIVNGPEAVYSLIQTDLGNAALTMSAIQEIAIWHSNVGNPKAIDGMPRALTDQTTAAWDGQVYPSYGGQTRVDVGKALNSPTGLVPANVGGPVTFGVLEHSYLSCVIGEEHPKMGVTTNRGMGYIMEAFQPLQRFNMDTKEPVIGWPGVKFKEATIVVSQYAPGADGENDPDLGDYSAAAETLAWLNPGGEGDNAYFRLHTSTSEKYSFGFTGFKVSQDSTVVAGQLLWAGAFTMRTPRLMRILYGING